MCFELVTKVRVSRRARHIRCVLCAPLSFDLPNLKTWTRFAAFKSCHTPPLIACCKVESLYRKPLQQQKLVLDFCINLLHRFACTEGWSCRLLADIGCLYYDAQRRKCIPLVTWEASAMLRESSRKLAELRFKCASFFVLQPHWVCILSTLGKLWKESRLCLAVMDRQPWVPWLRCHS